MGSQSLFSIMSALLALCWFSPSASYLSFTLHSGRLEGFPPISQCQPAVCAALGHTMETEGRVPSQPSPWVLPGSRFHIAPQTVSFTYTQSGRFFMLVKSSSVLTGASGSLILIFTLLPCIPMFCLACVDSLPPAAAHSPSTSMSPERQLVLLIYVC